MENGPKVSVVIPNFNHAQFLEQRISTVLTQSYRNFEVVILDDNSGDNSLDIIKKFENNSKISRIILNKKRSGSVFKQWIKGINVAKGEYLWIAESDDYAHKDFLKETVSLAETDEEVGLVFTDSFNVNGTGKIKEKISLRHPLFANIKEEGEQYVFGRNHLTPTFFIDDMLILNVSAVLFNLDKLKASVNLPMLSTFKNTGDQFTYISIFLKYKMIYLNKPLNYRRNHDFNTTKINFASGVIYKERIEIINYFFSAIEGFSSSRVSFNNFLRSNFLPATDFLLLEDIRPLVKKLYRADLISLKKYLYLSAYIYLCRRSSKYPPFFLRKKIKGILVS